jgi:hypothetical protein
LRAYSGEMMEVSLFQSYNEFALIAVAVAAAYLGAVWLITMAVGLIVRFRGSRHTSCRPGEMVHQALKVSGRLWDHYRTAALLLGVSFLLLVNFGRYGWLDPKSTFVNILILACLLLPLGFGALKILQLARYRLRLTRLLNMHTQMAQRLVEVQLRGNRVYPSVRIHDGLIDNVVVGNNGVYAVQLLAPPPTAESVKFERGALIFQPCGTRIDLHGYNKANRGLASVMTEQVGSPVNVLPVIVLPDCRIVPSESNGPLLVSLQACASFVSWQDENFFLHNEDVVKLSGWLGKQALEDPPRTLGAVISSLERQINWPALV